jgi:hypothetical protein
LCKIHSEKAECRNWNGSVYPNCETRNTGDGVGQLVSLTGGIPLSPDSEGEESEEESEVLEESPCGRWRKMRAEVRVPGASKI